MTVRTPEEKGYRVLTLVAKGNGKAKQNDTTYENEKGESEKAYDLGHLVGSDGGDALDQESSGQSGLSEAHPCACCLARVSSWWRN